MKRAKRFLTFVALETLLSGLFFWIMAAVVSLLRQETADLFSTAFALVFWASIISLPFIFVGACVCALGSGNIRPPYDRLFYLIVGFFCLFPALFTKGIDSFIMLVQGSLGLLSWYWLSDLLRNESRGASDT